ncbi:MAG: hypothetical protein L6V93_08650 [Clostridiales bacterium]|nr:MAG: hypothetical protein L6V93_08650 [Clostridiales bacterium]
MNIMFDLSGKLAFVTGSSCGIGQSVCNKACDGEKPRKPYSAKSFRLRAGGRRKTAAEKFKLNC